MSYFDEFAKVLAGDYSRRQMLGKMAGVVGGAIAGVFTFSGKSSAAYSVACTNFCRTIITTAQRNACLMVCTANGGTANGLCRVGNTVKRCPPVPNATTFCNAAGACLFTCAPGFTKCGNTCVLTQGNDPFNCGGCGVTCQQGQNCVNGVCIGCAAGQTNCSGACVDTQTDPFNCNGCGAVCPNDPNGTPTCVGGACDQICNQGFTNCTGACIDTLSDPNNCSACANACPAGNNCCTGACSDPLTDVGNCGFCANACAGVTPACCAGACADLNSDPTNCGTCGISCQAGDPNGGVCVNGAC